MNEPLNNLINQALALTQGVPCYLTPDWDGTNHYELHGGEGDYFWLHVEDALRQGSGVAEGKRLGYCLDAAAILPKLVNALTGDNSYAQGFRDGEQAAMRKYEATLRQMNISGDVK